MRFHVLGVGSVGTLISHHLRQVTNSPISLLVRYGAHFRHIRVPDGGGQAPQSQLSIWRSGELSTSSGFDVEKIHSDLYPPTKRTVYPSENRSYASIDPPNSKIDSLIVTLKTHATVPALRTLAPRIGSASVVTLLQNGMGMYDQLCAEVFPDPATRPFFIIGSTTHGVTKAKSGKVGEVVHNTRPGEGDIKWGLVPDPRKEWDLEGWMFGQEAGGRHMILPPRSPTLPLRDAALAPRIQTGSYSLTALDNLQSTLSALLTLPLNSTLLPMPHLQHQLLLKLAVNASINPLTALLGLGSLPNGSLLASPTGYRLVRSLCTETSDILTAYLSSLHSPSPAPSDLLQLFSAESLTRRTVTVIRQTNLNKSSMAADISSGNFTEINEINGYLVNLANRLGVPCVQHKFIMDQVKFVSALTGRHSNVDPTFRLPLQGTAAALKDDAKVLLEQRDLEWQERKLEQEEKRIRVAIDRQVLEKQQDRRLRRARDKNTARRDKDWYQAMIDRQVERGEDLGEIQERVKQRLEKREHRLDYLASRNETT